MESAPGLNGLPVCQEGALPQGLDDLPEGWRCEKGTAKPEELLPP